MHKKHILCPIDFSQGSEKLIQTGIDLASRYHAKLTLLTVVEPLPVIANMYLSITEVQTALEKEANEELVKLAMKHQLNTKQIKIVTGDPKLEIIRVADELGVDLIIISDKGHHGIRHQLMGSTTRVIANCANCDVYITRY